MKCKNLIKLNLLTLLTVVLFLLPFSSQAIVITDNATPAQLTAALQGANVTISNMQIVNNGCANRGDAIGLFSQGTTPTGPGPVLGDTNGVTLATGALNQADPLISTNNDTRWDQGGGGLCGVSVSDPDMVQLEGQTAAGEYVAIEFDIVPTKNTMAIPFQFGSDEFPEYVCSNYNDITGIFVSGPGINGPYTNNAENFAKTPAGDLTSINWVNTGVVGQNGSSANCGSLTNTAYYTDNSNGDLFGGNATVATTNQNLELDGWTNYIYQPITVVPGQTYHVKAVIADAGDRQWDSAVFFHLIFSSDALLGFDFGDAPDTYRTLTANSGPRHGISADLYLGITQPDDEVTGQPTANADGDDLTNINDEDGVSSFPALSTTDTSYSVDVTVNNSTGNIAQLLGWVDFNGNGVFDTAEGTSLNVPTGTVNGTATLNWTGLSGLVGGTTYARFRLTTDSSISTATPGGTATDGEVEDYTLTITTPDLSGSTKDVIDINGGDANPDDVLRYTITVTESAGSNAIAQVTDNIPANVNAFTVISIPAGAVNNSTGAGTGLNGNGYLDISNISIPANSSVDIVFDVKIDSGAVPGTLIDNTATVINPGGPGATPSSATIIVAASGIPTNGNKALYLYGAPGFELSRLPTPGTPASITLNEGVAQSWLLSPALQTPITISPSINPNIPITLFLGETGNRQRRDINVSLTCVGTGTTTSQQLNVDLDPALWVTFNLSFPGGADITCADQWQLTIQNNSTGGGQRAVIVSPVSGGSISQVLLPSLDVINVDSVTFHSATYPAVAPISSAGPNDTIYIRSVVSDPFGSFDITGATLSLTDGAGAPVLTGVSMTEVNDSGAATKIYEYTYTLPATPVNGLWNASVTATEGTEGIVTHTDTASISVPTPLANLSTSTKTVVDLNGGDAEPGDTLRYTIDIIETGGGVGNNIQVTDTIPANVNSFTVVSIPVGAVDNSNPTGGVNGTGFLSIDTIAVPANTTVSIVFDVTIDLAAVAGTLIDNSATIFNPTGTGGTPNAPTVIVSASLVPSFGNKPLYVSAPGTGLFRDPAAVTSGTATITAGNTQTWTLSPALQTPVTISTDVNPTVPVTLYLGETGTGANRDMTISLTCVATGTTLTQRQTFDLNPAIWVTFNLPFPNPAPDTVTCSDQWQLSITNNDGGNRTVVVNSDNGGINSRVLLPSIDVINVNSVLFYDDTYANGGNLITTVNPGDTISIRTVVSDPFGSFDISGATLDLDDSNATAVLTGVAMTEVNDSGAATKTYEYIYTVPVMPPLGFWTTSVTAAEGTEGNVTDTTLASFEVVSPPVLTIVKSADLANVNPGEVITYTITVNNTGGSPATTVQVDDALSPYIAMILDFDGTTPPFEAFDFVDGGSGLTFDEATDLTYFDAGGVYIPDFVAGEDGAVVSWQLNMTGSFNAGGQFTLRFKVRVK